MKEQRVEAASETYTQEGEQMLQVSEGPPPTRGYGRIWTTEELRS